MLRILATRTRDRAETHMARRVAPHTNSQRQYKAGMEVKRNNKLPTAVGMDKDKTWAMEAMVSSGLARIAPKAAINIW